MHRGRQMLRPVIFCGQKAVGGDRMLHEIVKLDSVRASFGNSCLFGLQQLGCVRRKKDFSGSIWLMCSFICFMCRKYCRFEDGWQRRSSTAAYNDLCTIHEAKGYWIADNKICDARTTAHRNTHRRVIARSGKALTRKYFSFIVNAVSSACLS